MRTYRGLIALALLAATAACGPDDTAPVEPTAETVVQNLFVLAADDAPELSGVFGPIDDEQQRAALFDAIRGLRLATPPTIVGSYSLDDQPGTGFDLEGRLAGNGIARYTVLLDTTTPPGLIVWFSGPGVEWPERKRGGPGVSTSAPPAAPEGG